MLAAAVAMLVGVAPATASRTAADGGPCALVSAAQLYSTLGLSKSLTVRNTTDSGEAVRHECDTLVWSGPTPTSVEADFQAARSGHGAQFGLETWRPNGASPDVQRWQNNDYDKLTGGFDIKAVTFPGLFTNAGWPAKHFQPSAFGYQTDGFVVKPQGLAKGLIAAIGCWWNDSNYSAVCLLDEEAAFRPAVKHLNELAKVAVPIALQ